MAVSTGLGSGILETWLGKDGQSRVPRSTEPRLLKPQHAGYDRETWRARTRHLLPAAPLCSYKKERSWDMPIREQRRGKQGSPRRGTCCLCSIIQGC